MAWTWTWKAKGKILCLSLFCVEVLMIHLGMARFVATFFFFICFGFWIFWPENDDFDGNAPLCSKKRAAAQNCLRKVPGVISMGCCLICCSV